MNLNLIKRYQRFSFAMKEYRLVKRYDLYKKGELYKLLMQTLNLKQLKTPSTVSLFSSKFMFKHSITTFTCNTYCKIWISNSWISRFFQSDPIKFEISKFSCRSIVLMLCFLFYLCIACCCLDENKRHIAGFL